MSKLFSHSIIVAQCTPQGQGALALIRLTGIGVFDLVENCSLLSCKKKITQIQTHAIAYGAFTNAHNEPIDYVLFFKMNAPHTFTGYDTVEITCHNNIFIINSIIETVLFYGGRLAEPGEFTRLAVLNQKIDIVQAEAIDEIVHAASLANVKSALKQLEGSFSSWIDTLEQQLLTLLALTNAHFEFIEEENINFTDAIQNHLDEIMEKIKIVEKNFDAQVQLKEGFKVVLIGSVNAGKSSIFNALCGKNRAIVHDIAGTTRDVIETTITRNGRFLTFVDTAGLRITNDSVEQEGINRSFQQAALADVILLTYDSARTLSDTEYDLYDKLYTMYHSKIIKVFNKIDQPLVLSTSEGVCCSALRNEGIDKLVEVIDEKITVLCKKHEMPFLVNKRHMFLLQTIKKKLEETISLCKKEKIAYELVSCQLHDILVQLSELSGKTISEKMMDRVFATFCVGK